MRGSGITGTASGADDPRLVAALEECLAGLEDGLSPDREALQARYPDLAQDLLACLDGLEFVHQASPQSLLTGHVPATLEASGRIGDYRLIREIGRGGMGVVYEAEQISLSRQVALKVLPFAAALDAGQLRRFQNEARVAALLQHPHVVPVYATGCERGVHYYAMQYIDGPSLAALIDSCRRHARTLSTGEAAAIDTPRMDDIPTRTDRSTPTSLYEQFIAGRSFVEAARFGAEAAEALEAAHQAGIIHRDVKPSNLLLDSANSLWVADFGLARFSAETGLTRTGNMLGTIRYMSPEQATGRPGLVDHRADIYSLGATLYELITLRPAFPGGDRQRLLRQIEREEPPRPRSVDHRVPLPLEAVVVKAMAKHPGDRYSCAAELALDLRRFMEGRPVRARSPSIVGRCRRWAGRHSSIVLAATAVITLLLVVVSLAAVAVTRQRDAAESGRSQARRAVDEMYTEVAERWLAREPRLELVQQEFLEKARRFYEEFASDSGHNQSVNLEAVRALRRVGDIQRRLGRLAEAEAAYAAARSQLECMLPLQVELADVQRERALLSTGRGSLFFGAARLPEAEQEFREALACYERLAITALRPDLLGQAGCEVNLGAVLAAENRAKESEQIYANALTLFEALCRNSPGDSDCHSDLASCLTNMGNLLASDRPGEAEILFERALAIEDRLISASPRLPAYQHARASTARSLATVLIGRDRPKQARSVAERMLELSEHLAADFPHTPLYQEEVAAGQQLIGDILAVTGRSKDARGYYQAAATNFATVARSSPESPDCNRGQAEAHSRLGDLLLNSGRPSAAEEYYRAALSRLSGEFGSSRSARQDRARNWSGLGNTLALAGRTAAAELAHATAVAIWEALAAEDLAGDCDRWGLAAALCEYATLENAYGKRESAEVAYRRSVALSDRLVAAHPDVSAYRVSLAAGIVGSGSLLLATARTGEAEADLRQALALATTLASDHSDIPEYQRLRAACLVAVARLRSGTGAGLEAETVVRQAVAISLTLASSPARALADERNLVDALAVLANLHARAGRVDDAVATRRRVLRLRERLVGEYPEVPAHRLGLAWSLVTSPGVSADDAHRAYIQARTAIALAPEDADGWLALGASAYRCGAWIDARSALQSFARLRDDQESPAGFFLAMASWQLGDRAGSADQLSRAEAWMKRHGCGDDDLESLRNEAAALLHASSRK